MDPLLPLMTVKETLLFFGGLKDIDSQRARRLPQGETQSSGEVVVVLLVLVLVLQKY